MKRKRDSNNCGKELATAEQLALGKACVYATGSFGRGEASAYSDLDLFIVGRGARKPRTLSRLTEIRIEADLIEATNRLGIPEFSDDGEYLVYYSEQDLIKTLGTRDDDATNTFTARLLLLLESKPLLGHRVYENVIKQVIEAYWRDYAKYKSKFMPAFLANDILRLWRTLCVNYEAGTASEPERAQAKRKLKNYKLKHSRLLTCYSGLLYLLAVYVERQTVHAEDAIMMTRLTPTERLEHLPVSRRLKEARATIAKLLTHYERFLEATNFPKEYLIEQFLDPKKRREYFGSESELGNLTFRAIEQIGRKSDFHRVLVV